MINSCDKILYPKFSIIFSFSKEIKIYFKPFQKFLVLTKILNSKYYLLIINALKLSSKFSKPFSALKSCKKLIKIV